MKEYLIFIGGILLMVALCVGASVFLVNASNNITSNWVIKKEQCNKLGGQMIYTRDTGYLCLKGVIDLDG